MPLLGDPLLSGGCLSKGHIGMRQKGKKSDRHPLDRILKKVEDLGEEYFVIHSEIKPYGPGTRRFILGKHTELPQKVKKLPNGKFTRSHGKQKYFNVPLPALEFEDWLDKFSEDT